MDKKALGGEVGGEVRVEMAARDRPGDRQEAETEMVWVVERAGDGYRGGGDGVGRDSGGHVG